MHALYYKPVLATRNGDLQLIHIRSFQLALVTKVGIVAIFNYLVHILIVFHGIN